MKLFVFIISFLLLASCKNSHTPLFKKDYSNESERNNNLLVFVGEQLESVVAKDSVNLTYPEYKVKFKILQTLYGEYQFDTIAFISHVYNFPSGFIKSKNSLIFLKKVDEKYFEASSPYDVYKAKNGKWASVFNCLDAETIINYHPEKIEFEDSLSFPAIYKDYFGDDDDFPCSEPYYKLEDERKIPLYGFYVDTIFTRVKDSYFTKQGLFGNYTQSNELEISETEMAEVKKDELDVDELQFAKSSQALLGSIYKLNFSTFKKLSLNKLNIKDSIILLSSLNESSFKDLFQQKMLKKFNQIISRDNIWSQFDSTSLEVKKIKKEIAAKEKKGDRILIMSYNFYNKRSKKIALVFKKVKGEYKFSGYDSILFPIETSNIGSYYVP